MRASDLLYPTMLALIRSPPLAPSLSRPFFALRLAMATGSTDPSTYVGRPVGPPFLPPSLHLAAWPAHPPRPARCDHHIPALYPHTNPLSLSRPAYPRTRTHTHARRGHSRLTFPNAYVTRCMRGVAGPKVPPGTPRPQGRFRANCESVESTQTESELSGNECNSPAHRASFGSEAVNYSSALC